MAFFFLAVFVFANQAFAKSTVHGFYVGIYGGLSFFQIVKLLFSGQSSGKTLVLTVVLQVGQQSDMIGSYFHAVNLNLTIVKQIWIVELYFA